MRKALRLSREALAPLADAQLESVAGGLSGPTCYDCFSLDRCPVPTLPFRDCFRETSPCTS